MRGLAPSWAPPGDAGAGAAEPRLPVLGKATAVA